MSSLGVYATIVDRRTRQMYRQISEGEWSALVGAAADDVVHTFPGDHALGGTRASRAGLGAWAGRFARLYTAHRFDVRDVVVRGAPWATRVAVAWTATLQPCSGPSYPNAGTHWITLRWGRIVRIDEHLDTEAVVAALRRMAQAGVGEAAASPIESRPPVSRPLYHRVVRWLGHRRWFAAAGRRFGAPLDRVLYRLTRGRVTTTAGAVPVLLLTTQGRRSGAPRTTPVMYVRDGDRFLVSSEHFGQRRPAAWPLNLDAHPEALIQVGGDRWRCRARRLEGAEADAAWVRLVDSWPAHMTYLRRSGARHVFALELQPPLTRLAELNNVAGFSS